MGVEMVSNWVLRWPKTSKNSAKKKHFHFLVIFNCSSFKLQLTSGSSEAFDSWLLTTFIDRSDASFDLFELMFHVFLTDFPVNVSHLFISVCFIHPTFHLKAVPAKGEWWMEALPACRCRCRRKNRGKENIIYIYIYKHQKLETNQQWNDDKLRSQPSVQYHLWLWTCPH